MASTVLGRSGYSDGMVTSHGLLAYQNTSVRDSKRNKKQKKTNEETAEQQQQKERSMVWELLKGNGKQGNMEKYYCKVTCGAQTTKFKKCNEKKKMNIKQ